MNRDKIYLGICLILFLISASSVVIHHNSVNQRFSELSSLNSDLSDGSLDNYSQKEAEQILDRGEDLTESPFQFMVRMSLTGIFGLFSALLYEKIRYESGNYE